MVRNLDILTIYKTAGYYDGCFEKLIKDENDAECLKYPTGIKICNETDKIQILTYSAEDMLVDNPNIPIEYESEYAKRYNEDRLEIYRKEIKEIYNKNNISRD